MEDGATYLSFGFFVELAKGRQIRFCRLAERFQRGSPARMGIIDALSKGFSGSLDELITREAEKAQAPRPRIEQFVNALRSGGFLRDVPPLKVNMEPVSTGLADRPAPHRLDGQFVLPAPVLLIPQHGRYLWYDHSGNLRGVYDSDELRVAVQFGAPCALDEAFANYQKDDATPVKRFERPGFERVVHSLCAAGLLGSFAELSAGPVEQAPRATISQADQRAMTQSLVDKAVSASMEEVDPDLPYVVPVNVNDGAAPAALGILVAYAMAYEGGILKDKFHFLPMFLADVSRLIERAQKPGVFLFSNYLWTVEDNLKLSAAIKEVNPANLTIHGGPSTPKYLEDQVAFFADNPHVDIAVRGEGEQTMAEVLKALSTDRLMDLQCLEEVEGVSFRGVDGLVRTADRARIGDVNTIPSPYLTGLLDAFGTGHWGAILESNRGCPFGCTFCDWGSATLSKVRKFDIERVFAELEWCAKNKIQSASFADANFGMLERDVDIARKIADLKEEYGYPKTVATNYAKNKVSHLRKIIEIFAAANILSEGVVSLQSMDEETLRIIDRSNIRLDKYNELTTEFRQADLPLAADIMMGLPGSTPESFSRDLQECTNRDVRVRANPTLLLTNSPMNEPEYRRKYGITARPGDILMETFSYTREEWHDMNGLRIAFNLFDNWGILRYVARFIRRSLGLGEVEFYDQLRKTALARPDEFPIVSATLGLLENFMAPPGSWGLFMLEVRNFVTCDLGVADDSALNTTIEVQLAHLPSPGRVFPVVLNLEHDFADWQRQMLAVREQGHKEDWELHVPDLSEFGPATLVVNDPNAVCQTDMGKPMGVLAYSMRNWEMDSPVARPSLGLKAEAVATPA